jgi:hypothetical protein
MKPELRLKRKLLKSMGSKQFQKAQLQIFQNNEQKLVRRKAIQFCFTQIY